MSKLKVCPFCGSEPEFPEISEVFGTCYDAGCNNCCIPTMSIHIIDCFEFDTIPSREDAHDSYSEDELRYGDKFIEIARNEAINQWNSRWNYNKLHKPLDQGE